MSPETERLIARSRALRKEAVAVSSRGDKLTARSREILQRIRQVEQRRGGLIGPITPKSETAED